MDDDRTLCNHAPALSACLNAAKIAAARHSQRMPSINAARAPHTDLSARVDLNTGGTADAAMRTFWSLAEAWKLTIAEQLTLLGVVRPTLYQWRQGPVGPLEADVQQRLSNLFGIYAALQRLLPVPERADEWIRKPNTAPFLAGASALDRMMGGQLADLVVVRQYPAAEQEGEA